MYAKKNSLISGGTGSGKTTLMKAVLDHVPTNVSSSSSNRPNLGVASQRGSLGNCGSYLRSTRHGIQVRIAGCVIARQRSGTAHGFIFLSLEDETGIANAIIDPDLYEQNRNLVTYGKILLIEGKLQNIDKVVHVRMQRVTELTVDAQLSLKSHDFTRRSHVRLNEFARR